VYHCVLSHPELASRTAIVTSYMIITILNNLELSLVIIMQFMLHHLIRYQCYRCLVMFHYDNPSALSTGNRTFVLPVMHFNTCIYRIYAHVCIYIPHYVYIPMSTLPYCQSWQLHMPPPPTLSLQEGVPSFIIVSLGLAVTTNLYSECR
jgi:hypothetical protein